MSYEILFITLFIECALLIFNNYCLSEDNKYLSEKIRVLYKNYDKECWCCNLEFKEAKEEYNPY